MTLKEFFMTKTFWLTFLDVAVGLTNKLGKKYWPNQVDVINDVWVTVQPLALLFISAFAVGEVLVPQAAVALHAMGLW